MLTLYNVASVNPELTFDRLPISVKSLRKFHNGAHLFADFDFFVLLSYSWDIFISSRENLSENIDSQQSYGSSRLSESDRLNLDTVYTKKYDCTRRLNDSGGLHRYSRTNIDYFLRNCLVEDFVSKLHLREWHIIPFLLAFLQPPFIRISWDWRLLGRTRTSLESILILIILRPRFDANFFLLFFARRPDESSPRESRSQPRFQ